MKMMSFGKKEIEKLALIEPAINGNGVVGVKHEASESINRFSVLNLIKWFRAGFKTYLRYRERERSRTKLYSMSDCELHDIGLTRSQIDCAINGKANRRTPGKWLFVKYLIQRISEKRRSRESYAQLMEMNSRQLTDIGLTHSDIQIAFTGNATASGNTNLVRPRNSNFAYAKRDLV
jgi:uncharacterized protein YjiS (DUF1127 family)